MNEQSLNQLKGAFDQLFDSARRPARRFHDAGTALDIGAINDCIAAEITAMERLSTAHLSGSLTDQKLAAADLRKYAERVSNIAGALDARLSAHLQRKPKVA